MTDYKLLAPQELRVWKDSARNNRPLWVVPGLISHNGLCLVVGAPKRAHKTMLVSRLCLNLVMGGVDKHLTPSDGAKRVWMIEEEGVDVGVVQSFDMLEKSMKLTKKDFAAPMLISFRRRFKLDDPKFISEAVNIAKNEAIDVIVLDALYWMHSKNENYSNEMSVVMDRIRDLKDASGAAVVLIHHAGKLEIDLKRHKFTVDGDLMSRGSSVIPASYDNRWFIAQQKGEREGYLYLDVKNRYGANYQFNLEWTFSTKRGVADLVMERIDGGDVIEVAKQCRKLQAGIEYTPSALKSLITMQELLALVQEGLLVPQKSANGKAGIVYKYQA